MPRRFVKDPDAAADFMVDWSDKLAAGETISTSSWVVPTGITKDSDSESSTTATIWLSSGTVLQVYRITNRIVTNQSRTFDRTITVRINQT